MPTVGRAIVPTITTLTQPSALWPNWTVELAVLLPHHLRFITDVVQTYCSVQNKALMTFNRSVLHSLTARMSGLSGCTVLALLRQHRIPDQGINPTEPMLNGIGADWSNPMLTSGFLRGAQYLPIRYTERLAEAAIEPSAGSKGDAYEELRRNLAPEPLST